MPRALFLILLTLGSALPTRAEEIGLCAKTCVAERSRCQRDARALDQAERAGWAYQRQDVRMGSDASAEMERLEARQAEGRSFEVDLLARLVAPLFTEPAIASISCVGSVLILTLGLNMLNITRIKLADMLPSLVLAPLMAALMAMF